MISGQKDIEGWRNGFGEVFIALFRDFFCEDFCSNVFVSIMKTINSAEHFLFCLRSHDIRDMLLVADVVTEGLRQLNVCV